MGYVLTGSILKIVRVKAINGFKKLVTREFQKDEEVIIDDVYTNIL